MWAYVIVFMALIAMSAYYMRCKRPLLSIAIGSGTGLLALCIVGFLTANLLRFNIFTFLMSLIAGVPGVILVILLNFILV